MKNTFMALQDLQVFSKEDWLDRMYRKSDSNRTRKVAASSVHMFELFCNYQGISEEKLIQQYQALAKEGDVRSLCLSLDKFIQFLNEDHEEIILNEKCVPFTFKKKNAKTIRTYFSFVKSYLRLCHAIKISVDDVKDYIQFPKLRKEPRKAIPIKVIKLIFAKANPEQKALYSTLISSGMRIGEALQLTKKDFHFNENPVRVSLKAEITKTKEARETFISREAVDKLLPIIEKKNDNDKVFTDYEDSFKAVVEEDQYFGRLRERLQLTERYENSRNFIYSIHSFRAYFHTKASQKHGVEYANALDGHGAYLKQYYRDPPEIRAKKYKELEPSLLIESYKLEVDNSKDKLIDELQDKMQKLQDKMTRLELINKH